MENIKIEMVLEISSKCEYHLIFHSRVEADTWRRSWRRAGCTGEIPFPPKALVPAMAGESQPTSRTGWQLSGSVSGPNEVINIKQIQAPLGN